MYVHIYHTMDMKAMLYPSEQNWPDKAWHVATFRTEEELETDKALELAFTLENEGAPFLAEDFGIKGVEYTKDNAMRRSLSVGDFVVIHRGNFSTLGDAILAWKKARAEGDQRPWITRWMVMPVGWEAI